MAIVAHDTPLAWRCAIGSVQLRGQTVGLDFDGELDLAGVRALLVVLDDCRHQLERDTERRAMSHTTQVMRALDQNDWNAIRNQAMANAARQRLLRRVRDGIVDEGMTALWQEAA